MVYGITNALRYNYVYISQDEERYEEEPYESLQSVYPEDEDYELIRPNGTQILLYKGKKDVKPDVVFETSETKMSMHDQQVCSFGRDKAIAQRKNYRDLNSI